MPTRALVVEDHPFTRLMLSTAMRADGLTDTLEASNASDAVSIVNANHIDVAILDLHLGPGPTGIDVAQAIRRKNPRAGIVFLTSFDDPRLLNPNLPPLPGNSQYLTKSQVTDANILMNAIHSAIQGVKKRATAQTENPLAELSDTQLETLRLVSQGLSNSEIARRRFITEKAVEVSIARIAKLLGLAPDATKNQRVHMAKVYFRASGLASYDEA